MNELIIIMKKLVLIEKSYCLYLRWNHLEYIQYTYMFTYIMMHTNI